MTKIKSIRKHGRAFDYNDMVGLSFSASGIEFWAEDGFECRLIADRCGELGDAEIHYARYGVYCDDELIIDERLLEQDKTLFVAESGLHRFLILKLSESADSTMFISSLKSVGEVKENDADSFTKKSKRIEFYGDSITCGYGVEGKLAPDEFYTTATENCTKAYAYLTAQMLDAEPVLVSKSGAGIISGYDGEGKKNLQNLIIPYFDKLGCSFASFNDGVMPGSLEWNDWVEPDVVVVNLGTNDVSYCYPAAGYNESNTSEKEKTILREEADKEKAQQMIRELRCEDFYVTYKGFLRSLRSKYPNAAIVSALGIMNGELNETVGRALTDAKAEGLGENVYFHPFKLYDTANDGIGTDYHPSEISQKKAAEELVEFIKENIFEK